MAARGPLGAALASRVADGEAVRERLAVRDGEMARGGDGDFNPAPAMAAVDAAAPAAGLLDEDDGGAGVVSAGKFCFLAAAAASTASRF